jgi:predicted MFS family arabinose efflux permease
MAAGDSCGVAPSQSMLSDIFSRKTLPVAIAIFTCASSISLIFYSPIAGWVAQHHGWRMAFIVSGIPGLIIAATFLFSVREPQRHGHTAQAGIGETLAFLAGSRAFLCILVGAAFMGAYIYGVSAWGTVFLMRVHHLSVQTVGTIISPVRGVISAIGILIGGALTSWLTRHHEGWRGWIAGLACFALVPSEIMFVFSDVDTVWFSAMMFSSLVAIMHQPAAYSALIAVARPRMRATSISLNLLITTVVGQILGPILIGAANDALKARYGDMAIRYSMLIAISCCALGAFFYFMSGFFMKRDAARATA